MLEAIYTRQFKRDVKRVNRRGLDIDKLEDVAGKLLKKQKLDKHYLDHKLTGNYKDCRECHIEPDWLLIYQVEPGVIFFVRTGTHADLFKK